MTAEPEPERAQRGEADRAVDGGARAESVREAADRAAADRAAAAAREAARKSADAELQPARRERGRVDRDDDPGALTLRNARAVLLGIPSFGKLLWRLMRDPRVSKLDRALFGGALAYVLTPVDLIPDWLPALGQIDDLVVIALVLSRLLYRVDEEVLLEHWEGAIESFEVMESLLQRLVDALPWWARRLV